MKPSVRRLADSVRRILIICALPLAMLIVPHLAHSHTGPFGITGYPVLILHPFIILDHTLCLVAAGLIAGQQEALGLWRAIIALLVGQVLGFLWLIFVPELEYQAFLPTVVAGLIGLLVAIAPSLGRFAVLGIVGSAGFVVGLNTWPEGPLLEILALTLAGLMLGSAILFSLVAWPVSKLTKDWQKIGVRIVGSWLAASICLMLALAFRQ